MSVGSRPHRRLCVALPGAGPAFQHRRQDLAGRPAGGPLAESRRDAHPGGLLTLAASGTPRAPLAVTRPSNPVEMGPEAHWARAVVWNGAPPAERAGPAQAVPAVAERGEGRRAAGKALRPLEITLSTTGRAACEGRVRCVAPADAWGDSFRLPAGVPSSLAARRRARRRTRTMMLWRVSAALARLFSVLARERASCAM